LINFDRDNLSYQTHIKFFLLSSDILWHYCYFKDIR